MRAGLAKSKCVLSCPSPARRRAAAILKAAADARRGLAGAISVLTAVTLPAGRLRAPVSPPGTRKP